MTEGAEVGLQIGDRAPGGGVGQVKIEMAVETDDKG
jgi:hypothetical protein